MRIQQLPAVSDKYFMQTVLQVFDIKGVTETKKIFSNFLICQ